MVYEQNQKISKSISWMQNCMPTFPRTFMYVSFDYTYIFLAFSHFSLVIVLLLLHVSHGLFCCHHGCCSCSLALPQKNLVVIDDDVQYCTSLLLDLTPCFTKQHLGSFWQRQGISRKVFRLSFFCIHIALFQCDFSLARTEENEPNGPAWFSKLPWFIFTVTRKMVAHVMFACNARFLLPVPLNDFHSSAMRSESNLEVRKSCDHNNNTDSIVNPCIELLTESHPLLQQHMQTIVQCQLRKD